MSTPHSIENALRGLAWRHTFSSDETFLKHLQPLIEAVKAEDWSSIKRAVDVAQNPEKWDAVEVMRYLGNLAGTHPLGITKGEILFIMEKLYPDLHKWLPPSPRAMSDYWQRSGNKDLPQGHGEPRAHIRKWVRSQAKAG